MRWNVWFKRMGHFPHPLHSLSVLILSFIRILSLYLQPQLLDGLIHLKKIIIMQSSARSLSLSRIIILISSQDGMKILFFWKTQKIILSMRHLFVILNKKFKAPLKMQIMTKSTFSFWWSIINQNSENTIHGESFTYRLFDNYIKSCILMSFQKSISVNQNIVSNGFYIFLFLYKL
jgi:hypothetical protein